jgi:hypothetical protein
MRQLMLVQIASELARDPVAKDKPFIRVKPCNDTNKFLAICGDRFSEKR